MSSLDVWLLASWMHTQFSQLNQKVDNLMAQVQVDQDELDALATQLTDLGNTLAAEIASLEEQLANPAVPAELPAGSLDGIKAAVGTLQGLQTPTATAPIVGPGTVPNVEPPADTTPPVETPPADTTPPADATPTA